MSRLPFSPGANRIQKEVQEQPYVTLMGMFQLRFVVPIMTDQYSL